VDLSRTETGSTKEQEWPSNSLKMEEGTEHFLLLVWSIHHPSFSVPQCIIIFNCHFHHYKL